MRIREMKKEDISEVSPNYINAYPGFNMAPEETANFFEGKLEREDNSLYLAVDEQDTILGGFNLIDYTIYLKYNQFEMSGIGGVWVGLEHKKRGVAKFLMKEALKIMRKKGVPISTLYPFRHDFYQKMGWGQVGEFREFKFKPSSLEVYPERKFVKEYTEEDQEGIQNCYDQYARGQNCMVKRTDKNWESRFKRKPRIYIYEEGGEIQGYMNFNFGKPNTSPLNYEMIIRELVALNRKAYHGLLGFVASQFDQVKEVLYFTHPADPFHHLLKEPRRADELMYSTGVFHYAQRIGIGWMFRLVDVEEALKGRLNYNGANLEVTFNIEDDFLEENSGQYRLILKDGKPEVHKGQDCESEIKADIATLSQLYTNYLTFQDAVDIGKIEVSDERIIEELDRAFKLPQAMMLESF